MLQQAARGRSPRAVIPPSRKPARKSRRWWGLAIPVVLLLAAGGYFLMPSGRGSPAAAKAEPKSAPKPAAAKTPDPPPTPRADANASAMGAVFNPFWVAVASGSGAAVGELTGYLAGFSGQIIIENRAWYDRLVEVMRKYGEVTILVLAFIPNPVFDLTGMAAGMLKMPLVKFLTWCLLGKTLKMLFFSYTGASIFNLFR